MAKNRKRTNNGDYLKSANKYIYASGAVLLVGLIANLSFVTAGAFKSNKIKTQMYEEISQYEEYQDYYQKGVAELDQLKATNLISEGEYERKKTELKDAVLYIEQLPEEEKNQFRAQFEKELADLEKNNKVTNTCVFVFSGTMFVGIFLACVAVKKEKDAIIKREQDRYRALKATNSLASNLGGNYNSVGNYRHNHNNYSNHYNNHSNNNSNSSSNDLNDDYGYDDYVGDIEDDLF